MGGSIACLWDRSWFSLWSSREEACATTDRQNPSSYRHWRYMESQYCTGWYRQHSPDTDGAKQEPNHILIFTPLLYLPSEIQLQSISITSTLQEGHKEKCSPSDCYMGCLERWSIRKKHNVRVKDGRTDLPTKPARCQSTWTAPSQLVIR